MADLLEEIELADQVGLDVFGVGEHHRPEFTVSAPAVVLAAAAARTTRIRLTSAVSVISSDDPVRVFQDFATLDLISGGRAEIMAGRGSFIESFPLFGYDLDDYDELFAEHLDLLLALRESEHVTWRGPPPRRRSTAAASTRARSRTRCRSGSRSAARRSRSCAPARSACRWRSRSSAASPPASRRSPSCTAARRAEAGHPRPRAQHQLARLHRRRHADRARPRLPGAQDRDGQDRPRARLAADDPRPVRGRRDAPGPQRRSARPSR